ncbi:MULTISPECIES: DUF2087 domain-containing protein [Enterococcus]|uniref:DUF2087 domain-containing protein n=1 Tax=Enterococcus TaxID=1350 RepID=UPI00065DBEC3|nr:MULTISPECIES: DUF2087 domain-containing protein [Enterococcus]KAF1301262.1 LytTR family transcriptional regulator [Enterococcus sp. JM9B]
MKTEKVYQSTDYLQGFFTADDRYACLYCDQVYEEGLIYTVEEQPMTAKKAMECHLAMAHNGPLAALLAQPREISGLTESQQEIIALFSQQLSDAVIAQRLGISTSTVRNHRFKLKEKERQAQVFLSMMQLLQTDHYLLPHIGAKMVDDRYQITEAEKQKVLANYLDEKGRISQFPSKEKRKIILLTVIAQRFDPQKNYSEPAVNEIIKQFMDDFATIRRYLIEYGFLKRTKDGKTYWVATE